MNSLSEATFTWADDRHLEPHATPQDALLEVKTILVGVSGALGGFLCLAAALVLSG